MSKSEEATFVIILTAIILGLAVMYYCFAPKHNDAATQSRIDIGCIKIMLDEMVKTCYHGNSFTAG
jgi:hypothetical protein